MRFCGSDRRQGAARVLEEVVMGLATDVSTIGSTPAYKSEEFGGIATLEDSTKTSLERRYGSDLSIKRENTTTKRVLRPCFWEAFVRLNGFRRLLPNWDSYDAVEISHEAIAVAQDLLYQAQEDFYPSLEEEGKEDMLKPIAVVPLGDGGVQLEWGGSAAEIEVEISPIGEFAFLLLRGRGAKRTYEEGHRRSISDIMVRLAHVLGP